MARRTEQSLRSKRPDAAQAPPDRRLGGVHHLPHAFSEGYREDALASLLQPGAQHPNLTSKLQLLLRVIAQQDIRHVMVRAQRRSRVFRGEDRLELRGQPLHEVAHATIASAYAAALSWGKEICTRLPATW